MAQRNNYANHRQLLLISGGVDWCQQQTQYLLQYARSSSLLLSNTVMSFSNHLKFNFITQSKISQYKQHLGTEYEIVIYNAFDGVKPSALYAIEGAIGKDGLLVIICPDLKKWQQYEAKHSGIAFSYNTQHSTSLFISRMADILLKDKGTAYITPNSIHLPFAYTNQNKRKNSLLGILTSQQQTAFKAILRNAKNDKSIGLITAKRGRGKSTLLGQIAAELSTQDNVTHIFITAPHINNAQRAQIEYKRFMANSKANTIIKNQQQDANHAALELKFIAPDQLCHLPATAILIVDEAAAIAPSILLYACQKFTRIVMATTLAGYEGSGLGFKLRVLPKLQTLSNALISVELHLPLRWYEEDGLEAVFNCIFAPFVDDTPQFQLATFHPNTQLPSIDRKSPQPYFQQLDKAWLIKHENILAQVFSLLIQSHYQTTPDDLMRILDSPDQHIVALTNSASLSYSSLKITGVAIIAHEGNIAFARNDPLLEGIMSSQRRVNGHLVAQNLAMTFCNDWFITANSWRISRIAVKPELRRLGLGKVLLQKISVLAQKNDVDYLSTSYGLTSELSTFWQSQGFKLVKMGARRDTSSGEHSGIMFVTLSERANNTFSSCFDVAVNDLDYFLNHLLKSSNNINSTSLVQIISQHRPELNGSINLGFSATSVHSQRISQFIENRRSLVNTAASIYFELSKLSVENSQELSELLIQARQKNLSKQSKEDLLSSLKAELKKISEVSGDQLK
ncbi:MAG: tRNA(Met) cytidine acetyltransferase [Glaciecola sp.]|jgi:tRNA(Met) cytidine acetyltransferase